MLLDFWATFCGPCRETIPSLVALQSRYGAQGLEIVGIACERDGTVQDQAHRVNAMCQHFQANYRQLLSQGSDCPVRSQFRIQGVPTLILIDSQGNISGATPANRTTPPWINSNKSFSTSCADSLDPRTDYP